MQLTEKLLTELQRRLKIGNRRGVHLNAIPANSRYKFDLNRLSHIDKNLPDNFVKALLSELPLKFRISWKDNVPDLNSLFEEDQTQLVRITKAFENLINQTEAIESEKGINTFGFGFPILARRDRADNKLTVAPILIWSLRIKRTKEFNTWEILRNEEDPIYINEVLINHLQSDANVEIEQISSDMLDDGLINKNELIEICSKLIRTVNTKAPDDLEETFKKKLDKITSIGDKAHYDKLPLNSSNSFIDFGGLFSIFEVQKQNIINEYSNLMELEGINIDLEDLEGHSFQPISSVETDPSQQSVLHSLEAKRNILIQGPPGTGKSQTLTAILINALENNKKTIVVCEKKTALDVLHDALLKKGLGDHCTLIRDIVKDRKSVVESVRKQVEENKYLQYKKLNSKESLIILLNRAKQLISTINTKHKRLDKSLIGDKTWSDVVGDLLAETKGITDDTALNIDNKLFNYSLQELNTLLEFIQKGQILYSEFSKIDSRSFIINPYKMVGDNPFIIEQNLKEDFKTYEDDIQNIKSLLFDIKEEYFRLRRKEIDEQIKTVILFIENILQKQKIYDELVEAAKKSFLELSLSNLSEQIKSIKEYTILAKECETELNYIISAIDENYEIRRKQNFTNSIKLIQNNLQNIADIINKYTDDEDFKYGKINSFLFLIKSKFSNKKRQKISDYLLIMEMFNALKLLVKANPDLTTFDSTNNIHEIKEYCTCIKNNIIEVETTLQSKISQELIFLNILEVKESEDLNVFFDYLGEKIKTNLIPDGLREYVSELTYHLKEYVVCITDTFDELSKSIFSSKDINNEFELKSSLNSAFETNDKIEEYLLNRVVAFENEKINEYSKIGFNTFNLQDFDNELLINKIENKIIEYSTIINFKEYFENLKIDFEKFFDSMKKSFDFLSNILLTSKDINLNFSFGTSYEKNKTLIKLIKNELEKNKEVFEIKVEDEYNKIDLINVTINDLKSLPILQETGNVLVEKIHLDDWSVKKIELKEFNSFINAVEQLIKNKNEYFNTENDLFTIEFKWFQFYNNLSEANKIIVNKLKSKNNWRKSFKAFYLNTILLNFADSDLPTNDDEYIELHKTLSGLEVEQLNYIRNFLFTKQINAVNQFNQIHSSKHLTVQNIYKKVGKDKLSLRKIVQFDPDLFTSFFPIILTSPDVASNLFKGMNGYFDIVMFDEASQLRLEDNLPAILKGKQIIIAGDEHQMPPSNYFSKVFDGTLEDEEDLEEESEIVVDKDNILLSCDSLLDFASELNFQRKYLDFHYRSRHPFLIDFSNYAFYNQRLKPLPNNFDYIPIKYIQVNGTFSEHTNEAEAEMVLSIIDKNINRLPNGEYPTIGIATFNIAQRNLIKSKILERQKFSKFEEFNVKIQELEEKGMFIKNLENIQGDERDVIILSTTYGIGKDRKFAQRFGPINHSKGYKLLNVIITRAKFKVYCCTSIPEQVFMNYKEYLTTEGSNNKRAVLYAYLAYCKAISDSNNDLRLSVLTTLAENTTKSVSLDSFRGRDLESPFEEEVYQNLADHLGTENLIPQLQFAGFRIDIVYDPKIFGVPKVAIECDGAKYHSSREAYLYDRHRQKILESHGFVFHRIWSTNWWRNSSRETTKLVDFIKQIESKTNPNFRDLSRTAFAFTDDIVMLEDYVSQTSYIDGENNKETIQAIEKTAHVQAKIFTDEVKLGSKVKVKYVNNGKDINIHIVSTENNKNEISVGIQKIYYKSPLAHSLLGQTVGDIVKIGNLDNFVEILQVVN